MLKIKNKAKPIILILLFALTATWYPRNINAATDIVMSYTQTTTKYTQYTNPSATWQEHYNNVYYKSEEVDANNVYRINALFTNNAVWQGPHGTGREHLSNSCTLQVWHRDTEGNETKVFEGGTTSDDLTFSSGTIWAEAVMKYIYQGDSPAGSPTAYYTAPTFSGFTYTVKPKGTPITSDTDLPWYSTFESDTPVTNTNIVGLPDGNYLNYWTHAYDFSNVESLVVKEGDLYATATGGGATLAFTIKDALSDEVIWESDSTTGSQLVTATVLSQAPWSIRVPQSVLRKCTNAYIHAHGTAGRNSRVSVGTSITAYTSPAPRFDGVGGSGGLT